MKVASWEHFSLDPRKLLAIAVAFAAATGSVVLVITEGVFGGGAIGVALLVSAISCYVILSMPRRILDTASLSQSKEAAVLAASGSANYEATHSRSRSLLLLTSGDTEIEATLARAKRDVLLGHEPSEALERAKGRLSSYSARNVLSSIGSMAPSLIAERGEETSGISQASSLAEESKLPLFMAVAFFAPIMLILFAVLTHQEDPRSFGELLIAQFAILDIAFYFSSSEKEILR